MTAALKAEISGCLEALEREELVAATYLEQFAQLRTSHQEQLFNTRVGRHRIVFTDAIIYRALAADLGAFPSELVTALVDFYTRAIEISGLVNMSGDLVRNLRTVAELAPRLARTGYQLRATLDAFKKHNFDPGAPLKYSANEIPERLRKLDAPPA